MKVDDLEGVITKFKSKSDQMDRYTSFDYCYNYFKTNENFKKDIEKSCLVLGFYLASWGMLRGSSFLLQKSGKHYQKLIEYYSTLEKDIWKIDIDNYSNETNSQILEIYRKTKELIIVGNSSHLTLTTKILLGVFGFIPAYDQYFCKTFKNIYSGTCGFSVVNNNSLNSIKDFYESNKDDIDKFSKSTFTTDFLTGNKTNNNYTKAKIIDIYGFTKSLK
jgi:hypothetical protein